MLSTAGEDHHWHHLLSEGAVPQPYVLLCVGKDGLEGPSQMLFTEVLSCPHEGRQGHGHQHLHTGKVLMEQGGSVTLRASGPSLPTLDPLNLLTCRLPQLPLPIHLPMHTSHILTPLPGL